MHPQGLALFCLQLAAMITVAMVFGGLARRFRQPPVLGELTGGILLGPTILGALAPGVYFWLFHGSPAASIGREAVVTLGLLFFLFVAGMEVNLAHLRQRGLAVFWVGLPGILVPFGLGFGMAWFWPSLWGPQAQQEPLWFSLLLGTALSISALPMIARLLIDLDLMRTPLGTLLMSGAIFNDLIGWILFAFLLSKFAAPGGPAGGPWGTLAGVLVLTLLVLTAGRRAGRRILSTLRDRLPWPSGFIGVTAIGVLIGAAVAEAMGIHAVFGAFLVGVALAPEGERDEVHETVYQFVTRFFAAPVYFVSIGLRADFWLHFDPLLVGLVLAVACLGKIGGVGVGAWLAGMPPREALALGAGMNARGAMEMILASVALEHGLIDERLFVALVVMAVVTSLMSGPWMRRLLKPAL